MKVVFTLFVSKVATTPWWDEQFCIDTFPCNSPLWNPINTSYLKLIWISPSIFFSSFSLIGFHKSEVGLTKEVCKALRLQGLKLAHVSRVFGLQSLARQRKYSAIVIGLQAQGRDWKLSFTHIPPSPCD